jgi:hypothetical protein
MVLAAAAVMMVLTSAGACQPYPPYWKAPEVLSVELSESVIAAGSTFTVATTVIDDNVVRALALRFMIESGRVRTIDCDEPTFEPADAVSVEFTCTMPEYANNGPWTVDVRADDGEAPKGEGGGYGWGTAEFEVTGGTDDHQVPVVEQMSIDPSPLTVGQPYLVTLRLADEHLRDVEGPEFLTVFGPAWNRNCAEDSSTRLTPTLHEWVFRCPAVPAAGEYLAIREFTDAIGNGMQARLTFVVE